MEKETLEVFVCSYCKETKHPNAEWIKKHEEICPMNPKNQPCSMCENQILGIGCELGMDMEAVGGNVLCFFYRKGYPKNPFDQIFKLDGNTGDDNNDDTNS